MNVPYLSDREVNGKERCGNSGENVGEPQGKNRGVSPLRARVVSVQSKQVLLRVYALPMEELELGVCEARPP